MKQIYKIMFIDIKTITYPLMQYVEHNLKWLNVVGSCENDSNNINDILLYNPDIIVCNSISPILTDQRNINKVKEIKKHSKIFILSGNIDYHFLKRCDEFEIEGYIFKPTDVSNIFKIIEETINRVEEPLL